MEDEGPRGFLHGKVEAEERITEVIKHAHEDHVVKLPVDGIKFVDGTPAEFDIEVQGVGREARLIEIPIINIDPKYVFGPAAFHLDGIEASIAANIENRLACERSRDLAANLLPFDVWKISQKVIRSCVHPVKVQVVKPLPHLLNTMGKFIRIVKVRTVVAPCAHVCDTRFLGISLG